VKRMGRFLDAMGKSILTVLVLLLIGYGWAFFEMKIMLKNNPELFGYIFYQQNTDDMIPDFIKDDIVVIKKNASYNPGDIVLYLTEDGDYRVETVTYHDAISTSVKCAACDENVTVGNSNILGRAIGKISYFGKVINFFKQKWFLVTLAIVGFIFVVVSQYIHDTPKQISGTKNVMNTDNSEELELPKIKKNK